MYRMAVFVDAGYLMSQLGKIKTDGERAKRAELGIQNPQRLIELLLAECMRLIGNTSLLRIYWYDGAKNGQLTTEHRAIVSVDDVQLRLGSINNVGQQKGVDSRIVTDLIDLAQKQAINDAVVVSGDADLAVGIEIAQRSGVRIGLLGFSGKSQTDKRLVKHAQSEEIVLIADRHKVLEPDAEWLGTITHTPMVTLPGPPRLATVGRPPNTNVPASDVEASAPAVDSGKAVISAAVDAYWDGLPQKPHRSEVVPALPLAIDKGLLATVAAALGHRLDEVEKRQARAILRGLAIKTDESA